MSDVEQPQPNNNDPGKEPTTFEEKLKYFRYTWSRDGAGQARETLLLVAALLATVTFQAGINPPPYLFQSSNESMDEKAVGTMVSVTAFLVANSISLSTSLCIIDYLTEKLPFRRELRVSMMSMVVAYGLSMGYTRPFGLIKSVLLSIAISTPLFLRFAKISTWLGKSEQKATKGSLVPGASS